MFDGEEREVAVSTITDVRLLPGDVRLVPVGIAAWRVVHPVRGPIGQVRVTTDEQGEHFVAGRFRRADQRMHPIGSFWSREDAVGALVHST